MQDKINTLTAFQVADFFIFKTYTEDEYIDVIKLSKFVFYADAWHLALYNQELIKEEFEAWLTGAIIPSLFERFAEFRSKPINTDIELPVLSDAHCEHLNEVYAAYRKFTSNELTLKMQSEEPWNEAGNRKNFQDRVINKELVKKFYKQKAESSNAEDF